VRRASAILLVCALAVLSGRASETRERGKWRLTVGASVIGGVRTRLGADAGRMVQLSRFSSTVGQTDGVSGSRSKAEAYALGAGLATADGERLFDGGARYNPNDSGHDLDGEYSWNWRLHDPTEPGFRGFVERTAYHDVTEPEVSLQDEGQVGDSTDWLPGLRVEASRELYCSEGARPWGVDVAVAFAYYFQRDLWKASGTAATSEATEREGYYEWRNDSNDEAQYILDYYRDSQFDGSTWGVGTFDGPGAELANTWTGRPVETATPVAHALSYEGNGSYREYSIEFLARPWWEPWEWLRVFASLGVEVSHREFDWSMRVSGTDGSFYREGGTESEWRALGLLGGGLAVQWSGFFLAGEALWRFGGDDLRVNGKTVSGSVTHGDWGFRLSLGYAF